MATSIEAPKRWSQKFTITRISTAPAIIVDPDRMRQHVEQDIAKLLLRRIPFACTSAIMTHLSIPRYHGEDERNDPA
jgi:hypothetical protein